MTLPLLSPQVPHVTAGARTHSMEGEVVLNHGDSSAVRLLEPQGGHIVGGWTRDSCDGSRPLGVRAEVILTDQHPCLQAEIEESPLWSEASSVWAEGFRGSKGVCQRSLTLCE